MKNKIFILAVFVTKNWFTK